ncbi:MAG: peptidylprolyl isomerase [Desulfomonilaceae bacterium]|jgi:peptidyl-prolyl cis-trans isomerase SurA
MKSKFILICLYSVFGFFVFQKTVLAAGYSDRIAAIVNSDVILESDVKKQKQPLIRSLVNLPLGIVPPGKWPTEREILDELVVIHLLEQEATKKGITLDDKAVDASIDSIKKRNNLTDEQFVLFLAANGLSFANYKQLMTRQYRLTKLIDSEVTRKTPISEEDAEKYYKKHESEINQEYQKLLESMAPPAPPEEESKPNIPTEEKVFLGGKIRLRQITLKVGGGKKPKDVQRVMETAKTVYQKAQTGEDFSKLAKKYSQDNLAKSGGDLGFMDYKDMVPQLQKMVQHMKVGDMTPPLRTADSFLMFYLDDAKNRKEKSLPIPEKTRKELEKRWKQEYEKRLAAKKSQTTQKREQESMNAEVNQNISPEDSKKIKSLGILTPEEIKDYSKVRNKVITILRTELIQSRMKDWIDELKRNSIIEVKL